MGFQLTDRSPGACIARQLRMRVLVRAVFGKERFLRQLRRITRPRHLPVVLLDLGNLLLIALLLLQPIAQLARRQQIVLPAPSKGCQFVWIHRLPLGGLPWVQPIPLSQCPGGWARFSCSNSSGLLSSPGINRFPRTTKTLDLSHQPLGIGFFQRLNPPGVQAVLLQFIRR